jgi:hypothetical protein
LFLAALVSLSSFSVASLWGSRTTNGWELLVIAYPDGRDVDVTLGGGAKTLTSTGLCSVKWRKQVASLEVDLNNLPPPAEVGWTGEQYVLWAVDSDKHITNLGVVPMKGKDAKWKLKLPARIFGLLVTAEKNAQAASPSGDVALETLLPKDPNLVVPVFRVQVPLAP